MSGNIVSLASRHQGSPSKSAIAEGIRARIRSGELPLGARISDKVIASELGISRTPVREALVQLQTEGLIVIRPQSGTFVTDLTPTDVHQICATRCVLEVGALRLGGEGIPRDRLARLGLLVGQASIALIDVDLARCDELDCDFHEALSWTAQQQNSGPTSATSNEC
jgi:DNA-binding GntR family transcriptional regulator